MSTIVRQLRTLVLVSLGACTSYPEGTVTMQGTLEGAPAPTGDAIFTRKTDPGGFLDFDTTPTHVQIKLTSFGGACGVANDQIMFPRASFLTIVVAPQGGAPVLPPPGTYPVGPSDDEVPYRIGGYFTHVDDACETSSTEENKIVGGALTIESAEWEEDMNGKIVRGTLDATFALTVGGNALQEVTGEIHAVACDYGWYIGGGAECVPENDG